MKILAPRFSEQYKTQVEAERQYVLHAKQNPPPVAKTPKAGPGSKKAHPELASPAAMPSLEEAFRHAHAENRGPSVSSVKPAS